MKNEKPFHIILIGSFVLAALVLVLLLIPLFWGLQFHPLTYVALPIALGLVSFFVFAYLIENFINKKIKLIYRIISKERIVKNDDSRNKLKEDVLQDLTTETERWAKARQDEISQLKKQAQFRKEFLGNLAHELKTPVFSIQGYILSLLEGGVDDPKVNRDFLSRASKATDRITDILDDLDDIMRYEANRFDLNIKKFDMVELVQEVIDSVEYIAKEKEITLKFKEDYDRVMVKGDRSKISQVLTNLIVNSINYGNPNGKTTVRFYEMDGAVMTEVADNGLGIAEEHLSRLFERFYRVDKSRSRHEGGSGLGLAIAKHIVESHGHSINVRSTEGVGSSFSFSLDKG